MTIRSVIPALLLAVSISLSAAPPPSVTVLLGRPTDRSVVASVIASTDVDAFAEAVGRDGGAQVRTTVHALTANEPKEIVIDGLDADREYAYTIHTAPRGSIAFTPGEERRFHTARRPGSTFTFAIEADPHLDTNTNAELLAISLGNVVAARPDFLLDLGDTFMTEKLARTRDTAIARYTTFRSLFQATCHSVPLLLVQGNHDGEAGWELDGTANSMAVWAGILRKTYFPSVTDDGFYSIGDAPDPLAGARGASYAFEWGDALFIVLDPFWNTRSKAGGWTWTLGRTQYDWLAAVLKRSRAPFKFVFIHHLVGGLDANARGGLEAASLYEWGGNGPTGQNEFDTYRKGWGRPIHALLVDARVTTVFHGHDHFFGLQTLDGVVYQEVPQPGWPGLSLGDVSNYGYRSGTFLPSSGYLLVTVAPDSARIDYVRAVLPKDETASRRNGSIAFSYTIARPQTQTPVRRRAVRP